MELSHVFKYFGEEDFLIGVTITDPDGTVWADNVLLESPPGVYKKAVWDERTLELEPGNYTIYFTHLEGEGQYRAHLTQKWGPSAWKDAVMLIFLLGGFCFVMVAIVRRTWLR